MADNLALVGRRDLDLDPVAAGEQAFLAQRVAGDGAAVIEQDFVLAAEGGDQGAADARRAQRANTRSIFAAQMKSFSVRPPTAWVV